LVWGWWESAGVGAGGRRYFTTGGAEAV